MDSYQVISWPNVTLVLLWLPLLFFVSLYFQRHLGPWKQSLGWLLVGLVVLSSHMLLLTEPAGIRMLLLCLVLLLAMKVQVFCAHLRVGGKPLLLPSLFCWFFLWPGMEPAAFQKRGQQACQGWKTMLVWGFINTIVGLSLLFLAKWYWFVKKSYIATFCLLLPALSFLLHFGFFQLLAGSWRLFGYNVKQAFDAPICSKALTEFWGQRWNRPFVDMTRWTIYRPLQSYTSKSTAAFWAFIFSGLLHEVAISLSVLQGVGLPMFYFVLHGALILLEKRTEKTSREKPTSIFWTRCRLVFSLVVPLPLLFHRPFVEKVCIPLLDFL